MNEYEFESEIICPYCLHKHYAESDDITIDEQLNEYECSNCEKPFKYECHNIVKFSSRPICYEKNPTEKCDEVVLLTQTTFGEPKIKRLYYGCSKCECLNGKIEESNN